MRISNGSSTDSSEVDDSEKPECSYGFDRQNWDSRDAVDSDLKANDIEMDRRTSLVSIRSDAVSLHASDTIRETSFFEESVDKYDTDKIREGESTQVQMNYAAHDRKGSQILDLNERKQSESVATSQTMLLENEENAANIIDNPFITNTYMNGDSDADLYGEQNGTDRRSHIIANQLAFMMCRNRARQRYSLPELTEDTVGKYDMISENKSAEIHRSSSMSNPRRKHCGILRRPRLINEKTELFQPLPEDHPSEDMFDSKTDTTFLSERHKESSEMFWGKFSASQENGNASSMKSLENSSDSADLKQDTGELQLPSNNVDRLSSGVFSNDQSESDSDSDSCNYDLNRSNCDRISQISAQNGASQDTLSRKTSECSISVNTARKRRSANSERRTTVSSNIEVEYLSEMRIELTNEVRNTRKSLEGIEKALATSRSGNGLINIGYLAKDLTESKAAVENVSLKIDHLSNDVMGLKKEMKSLTALVRLLIEQQSSR